MNRHLVHVLLVPACLALGASAPRAQFFLEQEFDSGALDVAGTVIDLSQPTSPFVTLEPRRFSGNWPGNHWWVYFRVRNTNGLRPRFRIPTANAFQAYTNEHRFAYSYTPEDVQSWRFFDNGQLDGTGFYTFSDDTAFDQAMVYVAYGIPHPVGRIVGFTIGLIGNPLVSPTASGNANLVIGQTPGTAGGGYVDDLGRTVLPRLLLGYRIGDGGGGPKQKVVVVSGNHSGEPPGGWTLEGFVGFLLSNDPVAVELRSLADVYVYPMVDPEGRVAGYFRSNPENPTENHNRFWGDPTGFSDITMVRSAIVTDTGGAADVFLDFHGYGSPTDVGYLSPTSNATTWLLRQAILVGEPDMLDLTIPNPQPGATAARWAAAAPADGGLGARVSVTPEAGFLAGQGVDRYAELGENWARAVHAALVNEPAPAVARSGAVFREDVLALGPRMYLALDEAAGTTAADGSGSGNDGTYVGGVTLGADGGFRRRPRTAVKLEGTSGSPGGEYVTVPDFDYAGASGEFSLLLRFRTEDVSGSDTQVLFSHGPLAQRASLNVFFEETPEVGTGDKLRTVLVDADDPEDFSGVLDVSLAPADGEWHSYALVVQDGAGASLYLDGNLVMRRPLVGGDGFDPSTDVYLGVREDLDATTFYGGSGAGDGYLDEVVLLDRALSPDEVLRLARASRVYGRLDASVTLEPSGRVVVRGEDGEPRAALVGARPAGVPATPLVFLVPATGLDAPLPAGLAGAAPELEVLLLLDGAARPPARGR